jgi:hypothetical protein
MKTKRRKRNEKEKKEKKRKVVLKVNETERKSFSGLIAPPLRAVPQSPLIEQEVCFPGNRPLA